MQEVTSDRNRDLRRSSLLWHLYQRKAAEARTVRPWKGRLFAVRQPLGEPHARDTSAGTHGECTHQEQWTIQSKEGVQISCQDECVRRQHSVNTNAAMRVSKTGWAGAESQQWQQDTIRLDSAHKDMGRWQLLGIRERVRIIQEWMTWETRQDISDAKNERIQDDECGRHNQFTSRWACWEYQARMQEGWSKSVATWFSEKEAEHDTISVESAQVGWVLIKSEHSKENKTNLNKTEKGSALDQPILENHQNASIGTEVARGNARDHLDHPDALRNPPRLN